MNTPPTHAARFYAHPVVGAVLKSVAAFAVHYAGDAKDEAAFAKLFALQASRGAIYCMACIRKAGGCSEPSDKCVCPELRTMSPATKKSKGRKR